MKKKEGEEILPDNDVRWRRQQERLEILYQDKTPKQNDFRLRQQILVCKCTLIVAFEDEVLRV